MTVQDPGAANVTAPVAARLMGDGKTALTVLCLRFAREVFRRFGVPYRELHDYGLRRQSAAAAARILAAESPDLVVVGTNEEPQSLDRWLTVTAKARGIPVVSILDYWCNYSQRFSGPSGEERFLYLPDLVFVMDEQARDEMISEGFPAEGLFISGHPYLEVCQGQSGRLSEDERGRFRRSLGVPGGGRLLTFVSETFGWTYDSSYRFKPVSGSRERTIIVLEHLLRAVTEIVKEKGLEVFILNKLHPKNSLGQFAWIQSLALPFPVRSVKRLDNSTLVQSSDLVVGMTSMFMLEAAVLGVPTLHVVPREIEEGFLGRGTRARRLARTPAELRKELLDFLAGEVGKGAREADAPMPLNHRGATVRAAGKLYQILGIADDLPSAL
ncbi:MAG TPA: hypothetical protein VGB25_08845 [Candidatus Binatia bacterium]